MTNEARVPSPQSQRRKAIARAGGLAVKEQRGPDYFRELGRKGGQSSRDRGVDLAAHARAGGEAIKRKVDPDYFRRIGKAGGHARWGTTPAAPEAP